MKSEDVINGAIVQVKNLEPSDGMMVHQDYLDHRREGAKGSVSNFQYVSETGEYTLVFVQQGLNTAAYWNTELDLLGVPA